MNKRNKKEQISDFKSAYKNMNKDIIFSKISVKIGLKNSIL